METVPCLVLSSRDLYTPNRQVNYLSPMEEIGMLRKALEKLDEKTIARAFGIESITESRALQSQARRTEKPLWRPVCHAKPPHCIMRSSVASSSGFALVAR